MVSRMVSRILDLAHSLILLGETIHFSKVPNMNTDILYLSVDSSGHIRIFNSKSIPDVYIIWSMKDSQRFERLRGQ